MVTVEQRLRRLLRYRAFCFPSCAQAAEISESLRPDDVVRFFAVSPALHSPSAPRRALQVRHAMDQSVSGS